MKSTIKKLILFFVLLLPAMTFAPVMTFAIDAGQMDRIHKSSCRVRCFKKGSSSGSIGSGIVCGQTDTKYLILTNNHVVDGCNIFQCDWFHEGKKITAPAELIKTYFYKDGSADFAFLSIRAEDLKGYKPPVIPLADEGTKPAEGSRIIFSGCSEGRWASCWVGTIQDYFGSTAQFTPAPKPGQSGSSLVQDINGKLAITAVLTWRIGDEKNTSEEQMLGGAIPIKNLWLVMDGKKPAGRERNIPEHALEVNENVPESARYAILKTTDEHEIHREAFLFSGKFCPPCRQAEAVVYGLLKKYPEWIVRELIAENDSDKKYFEAYKVSQTPSFVVVDIKDNHVVKIVDRWTGFSADLADRLTALMNEVKQEADNQESFESRPLSDQIHDRITKIKNEEIKTIKVSEQKPAPKTTDRKSESGSKVTTEPKSATEPKVTALPKQPEIPVIPGHHPRDYSIENGKVCWDMTRFQSAASDEQSEKTSSGSGSETNGLAEFFRRKTDPAEDPKPDEKISDPETKRNGPIGGVIDRGLDKLSGSAEKVISEKLDLFKADFFKYFNEIRNRIVFYGSLIFAGIMMLGYLFGGVILRIISAISLRLPKIQFVPNKSGDKSGDEK